LEAGELERAMNGSARPLAFVAFALLACASPSAQVHYQPAPAPLVVADFEPWYLAGDPVMFAGNIYYQAGPQVHFKPYEMIRSGVHLGVPLYTRTTIEPYSVVYVPLSGGLMQPYERRRAGDVAGTVGSLTPSFPVITASEQVAAAPWDFQAPTAPTGLLPPVGAVAAAGVISPVPSSAPRAEGLLGDRAIVPKPVPPRPGAANGVFIEYGGRRWFSAGTSVRLDPDVMRRIGEYRGFPVYARRGDQRTIYVPVTSAPAALVAPYSPRRR
jgi:hypothetical protein